MFNVQWWNIFIKFSHHSSSSGTSSSHTISISSWSSRGMLARIISSRSWRFQGFSSVPDFSAEPITSNNFSKSCENIFSTILICPIWKGWNLQRKIAVFGFIKIDLYLTWIPACAGMTENKSFFFLFNLLIFHCLQSKQYYLWVRIHTKIKSRTIPHSRRDIHLPISCIFIFSFWPIPAFVATKWCLADSESELAEVGNIKHRSVCVAC